MCGDCVYYFAQVGYWFLCFICECVCLVLIVIRIGNKWYNCMVESVGLLIVFNSGGLINWVVRNIDISIFSWEVGILCLFVNYICCKVCVCWLWCDISSVWVVWWCCNCFWVVWYLKKGWVYCGWICLLWLWLLWYCC